MLLKKSLPFITMLLLMAAISWGQSRKTVREKGISSITVQEYFIEEGMRDPLVETIEKYDKNGDLVELMEYNKEGEVKKWEKYAFDDDGNLVEEVFLDGKGRITRTEKNIYSDGLRVEKQFYNSKGNLYKRKVYEYEYRQ